jgi:hypothetical protein
MGGISTPNYSKDARNWCGKIILSQDYIKWIIGTANKFYKFSDIFKKQDSLWHKRTMLFNSFWGFEKA